MPRRIRKIHLNLTVDPDPVEILEARGTNISDSVNSFLKQLAGGDTTVSQDLQDLKQSIDDQRAELDLRINQEQIDAKDAVLDDKIQPFLEHYKKKNDDGAWLKHPERLEKYVAESARNLGISIDEFMDIANSYCAEK